MTWRAQNRSIGENKKDLIAAPHFHLSGGGGGVRGNIRVDGDSFH